MNGLEKISSEVQRLLHGSEFRDIRSSAKKVEQKPEQIELSRKGKELAYLLVLAREKIRNLPDIRHEKVAQVAERIKSGYYTRPEVYEKLADELIQRGVIL